MKAPWSALVFGGMAAVFLLLAAVDYTRHGSPSHPARKAWLRVGLIFTGISIYLLVFQNHFR